MDIEILPFAFPGLERVRCAFQTRRVVEQDSQRPGSPEEASVVFSPEVAREKVLANRRQLQERLGFVHWQECRQVHGEAMVFDPEPADFSQTGAQEADGLATHRPGQALVIKTADCQPLLLAHESQRYVAALHVGWRGNRLGFVQSAVAAFCDRYGLQPGECHAVRGPSLGPGVSEFVHFDEEWGASYAQYFDPERRTVDLWRLTRDQLQQAGLREERIFSLDMCTGTLLTHFFSWRKEKTSGRQANFIWLESD